MASQSFSRISITSMQFTLIQLCYIPEQVVDTDGDHDWVLLPVDIQVYVYTSPCLDPTLQPCMVTEFPSL